MKNTVLIVGAGPTGLVLALWLTKQGIPVRIIDKNTEPVVNSRALGIQARTLELYQQMDLAEEIVEAGHATFQVNLWSGGKKRGFLSLATQGQKLTPYPLFSRGYLFTNLLCCRCGCQRRCDGWGCAYFFSSA